jgi:hypothetical protein
MRGLSIKILRTACVFCRFFVHTVSQLPWPRGTGFAAMATPCGVRFSELLEAEIEKEKANEKERQSSLSRSRAMREAEKEAAESVRNGSSGTAGRSRPARSKRPRKDDDYFALSDCEDEEEEAASTTTSATVGAVVMVSVESSAAGVHVVAGSGGADVSVRALSNAVAPRLEGPALPPSSGQEPLVLSPVSSGTATNAKKSRVPTTRHWCHHFFTKVEGKLHTYICMLMPEISSRPGHMHGNAGAVPPLFSFFLCGACADFGHSAGTQIVVAADTSNLKRHMQAWHTKTVAAMEKGEKEGQDLSVRSVPAVLNER